MAKYQSKYTGEEIDNGINPVGTIISFMGTMAPEGFLVCDGAELNIADYSVLATHFETQFGTKNHFGGDGTTTFALPDLRNEFLRGYHNGGDTQLSGEIGIHQDATNHPHVVSVTNNLYLASPAALSNYDDLTGTRESTARCSGTSTSSTSTNASYTSRPTNVAVLYCIKF